MNTAIICIMYKTLNIIIDVGLRSVYDVSKLMGLLLVIFFMDRLGVSYFYLNKIFLIAVVQYIAIYSLFLLLVNKFNNKRFKVIYIIFMGTLSFVIPLITANMYNSVIKVVLAIFFLLISTKAILYNNFEIQVFEDKEKEEFKLLFILVIFFTIGMFFVKSKEIIVQAAKVDFIIVIVSKIICISRFNLLEEYEIGGSITIGKDKNLFRLNLISIFSIAIIFIFGNLRQIKFLVKVIYDSLVKLYSYLGIFIMETLSKTFLSKLFRLCVKGYSDIQQQNVEKLKQEEELRKKICEEMNAENVTKSIDTTTPTIIITIIIIIIVVLIISYILIRIQNNLKRENIDVNEIERKDFIFRDKKEDKPKGMYDLTNKNKLNKIRKLYIKLVYNLRKKGVKYDLSLTPLEYNKVVDESGYGNEYVRYIVQLYNKSRYGNKVITKDELDKSHKLRNEG